MLVHDSLTVAVAEVFRLLSTAVFGSTPPASKVVAYLAGGSAVHFYVGTRVSYDVDAEFLARFLKPPVVVSYVDEAGQEQTIHLDRNYSPTLAVLQEDYTDRAVDSGLQIDGFEVRLLSPVDLVISKLSRFLEHDQQDIRDLIVAGLVDRGELIDLAKDALSYFVGNVRPVEQNLDVVLSFFPSRTLRPPAP